MINGIETEGTVTPTRPYKELWVHSTSVHIVLESKIYTQCLDLNILIKFNYLAPLSQTS